MRKIDMQDDISVRKIADSLCFIIFGQNILPYYTINYNGCVKFISLQIILMVTGSYAIIVQSVLLRTERTITLDVSITLNIPKNT